MAGVVKMLSLLKEHPGQNKEDMTFFESQKGRIHEVL
ncbi:hypothetical protein F441_17135 [Phytophthora nicotianae CJ01A1]|uniref:Uncharacterized protein n=6 Tax=Phytophthora nicotianae TaxID=4792 RepID=W2PQF4_PHYN3|nr:hypothetical protein PPTG_23959 [Phytophthora nicotianae INRA-310]ETI36645.1 hypothetical protein F443_17265 [Phytophthora nicotianae P1569]ETK76873.1 hypothetical protein L915_16794 [Phytophthora nicotianae]ETO81926.1 hypothetical protein F444_03841 [Phytophthora nicotianae P1976]ETP06476.1 hypothetical protein F441_17135 [Phytophthora nicotianae CJ01A1]ETP51040.1 hypothetical protein F442_03749 [Phytophthora nicotianae P10297]